MDEKEKEQLDAEISSLKEAIDGLNEQLYEAYETLKDIRNLL